ncbi:MAG: DNA-directed RNA polymerase subunit B [Nanopusillaceae archaeon]|jgi:DNA-directed RNA polymerase subunit B
MATEVYIDNIFVGYIDDPKEFTEKFKEERRKGIIPYFVNIYYDEIRNVIEINTRKGRILRPLIVVKNGKPLLTQEHIEKLKKGELKWSDLEKQGIIEWVDPAEEENLKIALFPEDIREDTTHLELSAVAIFGIATSLVPFSNKNQSARLNRGVRPQRQAHATYTLNFFNRFDTDTSILYYPQQPIVRTFSHKIFEKEDLIGQNVIIAVMTQEGYNIEDAIIMNKGSIDRGLFRSVYFRSYETERMGYPGGLKDEITVPTPDVELYRGRDKYINLEEDGVIAVESFVQSEEVLVGKVSPPRFIGLTSESIATGLRKKDSSLTTGGGEEGWVDAVMLTESSDGNLLIKVRLRDLRIPELGDKFTVRHGQKGVLGMIVEESDMPWTSSGLKPDIIFSPASIPSRETVGLLLELLGGKVGSLNGRYVDGTPWYGEKEEDLRKELLSLGFREDGTETMYNPLTGDEFKAKIYIGSIYYLRLRHMAKNKLQARATGPVTLLTRQPTEGKSKKGGLRFSEMEHEVLAAHGASYLLREMYSSDDTVIFVCENCGSLAVEDNIRNRVYCPVCGETEKISKVKVSYGFTLLLKELISLGIWPRLKLKYKF